MSRLATLRSPTHIYKKLDEFEAGYDLQVNEMVESDTEWFAEKIAMEKEIESRPTTVTLTMLTTIKMSTT
jgi:hypothetical protein